MQNDSLITASTEGANESKGNWAAGFLSFLSGGGMASDAVFAPMSYCPGPWNRRSRRDVVVVMDGRRNGIREDYLPRKYGGDTDREKSDDTAKGMPTRGRCRRLKTG